MNDNVDDTARLGTPGRPALPYGPRTAQVRRFLQHAAALGGADWAAVCDAWRAMTGTPAGRRADRALGAAIEGAALLTERDAVVGPVVQLAQRVAPEDLAAQETAAEALLAAALALIAGPGLPPADRAALCAPFAGRVPDEVLGDEPPPAGG